MATVMRAWAPEQRLVPYVVHDLPRVAWVIKKRAHELTDEERATVREAATMMLAALLESGPDT